MRATPAIERLALRSSIVGEDTPILRGLPHVRRRMVGAWCFLDHAGPVHFGPGKGLHVGAHPHIGLQTFTWMIEGEVVHRDSLGNEQIIRPGEVNLMTAGRGIAHTEDSHHDGTPIHAAQLWIALPDHECEREPSFEHHADLPVVEAGGWRATVLAGTAFGRRSPVGVHTPLVGVDLSAVDVAATACVELDPAFEHALLLLDGAAAWQVPAAAVAGAGAGAVAGAGAGAGGFEALDRAVLIVLPAGIASVALRADDAAARVLLLGGEPFGPPPLLWWNFVARTQARMQQALDEWNAGGEAFGAVRAGSAATPLKAPALSGQVLRASNALADPQPTKPM